MKNFFNIVKNSFNSSLRGQESINNLIWWWGAIGYLVAYFIMEKIVMAVDYRIVDILVSAITVIYFVWHIYALKKCSPKKPKLTKEEKKKLKLEKKRSLSKRFMNKLLLRESITNWDPIFVTMVIDVFVIVTFLDYII